MGTKKKQVEGVIMNEEQFAIMSDLHDKFIITDEEFETLDHSKPFGGFHPETMVELYTALCKGEIRE